MEVGIFLSIVAIFTLLAVTAFFAGSETALTATSRVRLHAYAQKRPKAVALVNKMREKKDRMIGALLFGNTLVNILSSALATSLFIRLAGGEAGVIYATVVMTVLILIFGELLPKTYAVHHAESWALRLAPLMRITIVVFTPVTSAVMWLVRFILKIFGADISKVKRGSHLELLRGAIETHRGPEEETREQRAMLKSVLDLFEIYIEDIIIHRGNVLTIDADRPMDRIVAEVLANPYSRLPVWKGSPDNIIGILHVKQLLKALSANGGNSSKIDIASAVIKPWFVPETTSLHDQLQAFRERKEHFAVVVDEYGAIMGIVTLEDILEEIVGSIEDEHDIPVPGVRKLQDGSWLVDGTVTIRDLNREFEWTLPDENYSTLAGLILHESGILPEAGQKFHFFGFSFEIVRRRRNQIARIKVTASS